MKRQVQNGNLKFSANPLPVGQLPFRTAAAGRQGRASQHELSQVRHPEGRKPGWLRLLPAAARTRQVSQIIGNPDDPAHCVACSTWLSRDVRNGKEKQYCSGACRTRAASGRARSSNVPNACPTPTGKAAWSDWSRTMPPCLRLKNSVSEKRRREYPN